MANIIFSQGHGGADCGSRGADGKWERDRIRDLVPDIARGVRKYGHEVTIKSEKNANGRWAFSVVSGKLKMSFHFNCFNKKATGTEVLYKKASMKSYAAAMSKRVANSMSITNRGAKYRSDLYMMNIGFDLLIEVCFHDNKADLAAYKKNKDKVVDAIVESIVDIIGGKKSSSDSKQEKARTGGKLELDGKWGTDCTQKSQKVFKTEQDGFVSYQPADNKKYLPNCYEVAWMFYDSGYDRGSALIKAIQKDLKGAGYYTGKIDGWCGKQTVIAIQKYLKAKGLYTGEMDGSMGPATVKAWQKYINSRI